MSHLVWYTRRMIKTDMKNTNQNENKIQITKLGVKIVPLTPPTQKELDNSTSKGTRVLTYEESMER